jgi:hypothetical protein
MRQKKTILYIPAFLIVLSLSILSCAINDKAKKIDELMIYNQKNGLFMGSTFPVHSTPEAVLNNLHDKSHEPPDVLALNKHFSKELSTYQTRKDALFLWRD